MKRITSIIIAVSLSLSLAACASSTESSSVTSSITDKPVASVEKSGESVTITYPSYMIPGANSDSTDTEKSLPPKTSARISLIARVRWKQKPTMMAQPQSR